MSEEALERRPSGPPALVVWLIACALAWMAFALEGHIGFDLNDEGFLWYGTIETARGAVPVRDFQSYEPGRYYWGALWFWMLHDQGIVSLRLAIAAFEAIGLACGLFVARRILPSTPLLALTGLVLALWVEPRFRVFEFTITLASVLVAVRLLERPTARRHLEIGLFIGLAAFFGRNHALYAFVAGLLVCLLASPRGEERLPRRSAALAAGICLGATPLLSMILFVPGFRGSLANVVDMNVQTGISLTKGLFVPGINVPWPQNPWELPKRFAFATTLALLPALYAIGALRLLVGPGTARWNVAAASTIVGTVYLHHIYARPDEMHLASGIAPFFLLLLAFAPARPAWWQECVALLILAFGLQLSLETIVNHHPLYQLKSFSDRFEKVRVRGEHLWVWAWQANVIRTLKSLKGDVAVADDILIVPSMPGLYPTLQKRAPVWRLLFIFPDTAERQDELITTLERKKVAWAVVCDVAWDRRDELRLRNAYPHLYAYLQKWDLSPRRMPGGCELRERPDSR
jgi:hypothetical protein